MDEAMTWAVATSGPSGDANARRASPTSVPDAPLPWL
jgi:hypothetical protein